MTGPEIKKVEGVWTEAEVIGLKHWLESAAGVTEVQTTQVQIATDGFMSSENQANSYRKLP